MPRALSSRITSVSRPSRLGLTPPAGSSSRISFGSSMSTWASSTSFCWPYERSPARCAREAAEPDDVEQLAGAVGLVAADGVGEHRAPLAVRAAARRRSRPPSSRLNSRVTWNVRPRPRCPRFHGGSLSIRLPSKVISPASAGMLPVTRLNSVVLPEPFGPMSAVIVPLRDGQVDAVHRDQPAEALRDAAQLQQRLAGGDDVVGGRGASSSSARSRVSATADAGSVAAAAAAAPRASAPVWSVYSTACGRRARHAAAPSAGDRRA